MQGVRRMPSDNYNERPVAVTVDLLIIHNISLPPGVFCADDSDRSYIDDFFCNTLAIEAHPAFSVLKNVTVSAHFLVSRQGCVTQYVSTMQRAWHAGVSQWQGIENCNDFSIGIEMEGADTIPYTDAQYESLAKLTRLLMDYYPAICLERIVGHSDVAPGRKTDPGPAFNWQLFRAMLTDKTISQ